jgi:hypothetical protein
MQRCRRGECCKGGLDGARIASLRIAGSPLHAGGTGLWKAAHPTATERPLE